MTTQQKPEALRLAWLLELAPEDGVEPQTTEDAAAELRRQHARIAELEARIKTMAEEHADELMVAHMDGMRAEQAIPGVQWQCGPQANGFTAPQADSQPAGADRHGLPPLPDPDLRDVGTTPRDIKEFLRGYATEYALTALTARAPADSVLAAMETGEWEFQRLLPQTCFTSEANIRNAWSVKRSAAPYCTKDGLRIWTGATPLEALCNGAAALGVELPGCSETAALPKTVVAILGEQAELRRLSGCCPELNLSNA